jgi:hypothetical protein
MLENPSRGSRFAIAFIIALAAGSATYWIRTHVTGFSDFDYIWTAARDVRHGTDPYVAVHPEHIWPFFYPLPAALIGLPFAALSESAAAALWSALSFGLLTFGLTRRAWWPLIGLASLPCVEAAQIAQWSPLLTAMVLYPALGWLVVAKPTTGAVMGVAYLHRLLRGWPFVWSLIIGLSLIAAATVIQPSWVGEWLALVRGSNKHFTPIIFRPGGAVLLLAIVAWREAEARLIIMLAVTPLGGMGYDAVPLLLIPRSRYEAFAWSALTVFVLPFRQVAVGSGESFTAATTHNAPIELAFVYCPALLLVLRHYWLDRHADRDDGYEVSAPEREPSRRQQSADA